MNEDPIVIVGGARTPMGGFQGDLSDVPAPELGAVAIKAALRKAGVAPEDVDDVIMGVVLAAGMKQAPAGRLLLGRVSLQALAARQLTKCAVPA